jgi:hypothetical protein
LEHQKQTASERLAKVTRTHEEHAEAHERKLADQQKEHHQKMKALRAKQDTELKRQQQEHSEDVQYLQQSIGSLEAKTRSVPGSDVLAALQAAKKELEQIKVRLLSPVK